MGKLVMERRAADNKYLHRDFHLSADTGLKYIGNLYGDAAVKEFIEGFAKAWYAPLVASIRQDGLSALKAHIEKIYETEEAADVLRVSLEDGELLVAVDRCPAVTHMAFEGHTPSKWYVELTATVNRVIAELSGLSFEMISYDPVNGKAAYRFKGGK